MPGLPYPTLFPYTTLFRSGRCSVVENDCRRSTPIFLKRVISKFDGDIFATNSSTECPGFRCRSWLPGATRSEEHTSELQSLRHLVCRLLLEKDKNLLDLHA